MTINQKIIIILVILLMVFGPFIYVRNSDRVLTPMTQFGSDRYLTSVAWLDVCALFLTYQLLGLLNT